MNGTTEAPTGAPLAAHFEARRRILATVKQMEECGEKLEEATSEEILEAAATSAATVFKFDFRIMDEAKAKAVAVRMKKRNRSRKRRSKRQSKNHLEEAGAKMEDVATERVADAVLYMTPGFSMDNVQNEPEKSSLIVKQEEREGRRQTVVASSFLKLRKVTGTESEVTKMHLRYGQGRRNLVAMKQREQRQKLVNARTLEAAADTSSNFRFNFCACSSE